MRSAWIPLTMMMVDSHPLRTNIHVSHNAMAMNARITTFIHVTVAELMSARAIMYVMNSEMSVPRVLPVSPLKRRYMLIPPVGVAFP